MAISVAIVMPEIGFDDEPMMPTMRLATVTKKKPKTTISRPSSSLLPMPVPGTNGSTRDHEDQHQRADRATTVIGRSRSVRSTCAAAPPRARRSEAMLSLNDETIVGSVLISVMKPPAATAPAPIWRT